MREKSITRVSGSERRRGLTDHAALDRTTDEQIAERVASDPDAAPLDLDWASAELVIPPRKIAISIRLDEDVLDHFKRDGEGYQRRINAALRAYVEARSRSRPA